MITEQWEERSMGNTRKQKKGVGLFRIRDEWAKETNHSGDERIDGRFNRWNIVGMNERAFCVCLCLCVRRVEGG